MRAGGRGELNHIEWIVAADEHKATEEGGRHVVGMRGSRVQAVVEDLGGEKIDIIAHTDDPVEMIGRALSPAPILTVTVDEAAKSARVVVPERALSLAIGAGGQNARLAARLTGYRIDIASDGSGGEGAETGATVAVEPGIVSGEVDQPSQSVGEGEV